MADDSEDEWRFSVDDVGPDDGDEGDDYSVRTVGEDDEGPTVGVATTEGESNDESGNVTGSLTPDMSVEPGTPDLEGVAFATAGAVLTALVFAGVVTQLDGRVVAGVTGTIVAAAALLYVVFTRF